MVVVPFLNLVYSLGVVAEVSQNSLLVNLKWLESRLTATYKTLLWVPSRQPTDPAIPIKHLFSVNCYPSMQMSKRTVILIYSIRTIQRNITFVHNQFLVVHCKQSTNYSWVRTLTGSTWFSGGPVEVRNYRKLWWTAVPACSSAGSTRPDQQQNVWPLLARLRRLFRTMDTFH